MFTRQRQIGRHNDTEALLNTRDPDTGKSRHRCVALWRSGRSLAADIGHAQFAEAQRNAAFWQGVLDCTVTPHFPLRRAPNALRYWRRRLATTTADLTQLGEARDSLPAHVDEIERVATAQGRNAIHTSFRPPDTRSTITPLAERVGSLAMENDPEVQRAGLTADRRRAGTAGMTIVTAAYRYKRPRGKRKAVALAAVVLMMCGGHPARADRTVRCTEGPNMYHDKGTIEITVRQQKGGYEADGNKVDGHPVKSIFETKDRGQAVLYVLESDDDKSAQDLVAGTPVLIITVNFQTPSIVTYQVPLGSMSLPNPYYYAGCARLD